ncbi:hypothetical protein HYW53_00430 [Candidatus Giovannonibacteria bacterium]|nr:hypothetical protein [Candidatus Giovannonibacteria bacterium]
MFWIQTVINDKRKFPERVRENCVLRELADRATFQSAPGGYSAGVGGNEHPLRIESSTFFKPLELCELRAGRCPVIGGLTLQHGEQWPPEE